MSLRNLLQDQSGQFWGGFLGGLNQSMKEGRERSDKHKELELRKKQIDAQIKGMDADNEMKQHTLKQKMTEAANTEELAQQQLGDARRPEGMEGPATSVGEFYPQQGTSQGRLRAAATRIDPKAAAKRAMEGPPKTILETIMEMQSAQQIINNQSATGQTQQGTPGQPAPSGQQMQPPQLYPKMGPKGNVTLGSQIPRDAIGADSAERQRLIRQYGPEEGARQYQGYLRESAGNRAGGGQEGALKVRQTPAYIDNKSDVAQATGLGTRRAEAKESMVSLANANGMIDELDLLSKEAFKVGDNAGMMQRGIAALGQRAQSYDPASTMGIYEARKQTVGENLARSIGGVKGTATEGDITRMLTALPKIGALSENESSRKYKIAAFREIVARAMRNQQDFIDGKPVDLNRSRDEFKTLVDQFVAGKYVPGQPSGSQSSGKPGKLTPLSQ